MHRELLSAEELKALTTPSPKRSTIRSNDVQGELQQEKQPSSLALDKLHRDFAEAMSEVFSEIAKQDVEVRLRDQGTGTYAQFVFGQSIPTCCAIVLARAIDVEFYFAFHPSILYPLIDNLLGSSNSDPIPQRPLTEIEQGLAELLFARVLDKYEDAWTTALSLDFTLLRFEHNVQQHRAMGGSDETYRARYGVRFGCPSGLVELCLPWAATQQVRHRLAAVPGS